MLTKNYRTHVYSYHISNTSCNIFTLEVPFKYTYTLLSNHDFELRHGYVQIPCDKWKELFVSLFYTYLKLTVKEMTYSGIVQETLRDERIKIVMDYLNKRILGCETLNFQIYNSVDINSKLFPLCMQNLHELLLKNHRLEHNDRIDLSLFLKDIGISLSDSITYWKSEYTKEYSNCTRCTHSWQQNKRKYIYSIRHLYGLEGSRKTYFSKTCNYFQNIILNAKQEGGCPFKYFDDENLKKLLLKQNIKYSFEDLNHILKERFLNPSRACKLVARSLIETEVVSNDELNYCINNPVQYFIQMKIIKG